MPSKLYGKWKLVKNENFDEYMKEIGEFYFGLSHP